MPKTIKQLAEEIGCSKTAIRKYMDAEFREKYTETTDGNIIIISDEGCKLLAGTVKKYPENPTNQFAETPENRDFQAEIEFLRAQLEEKDRQINALLGQLTGLTTALEHTTQGLQAAQALHAGTMQQSLPQPPQETPPEPSEPPEPPETTKPSIIQRIKHLFK